MISMASDAAEVQSKMDVVFGKALPGLTRNIDTFSKATGTSRFAMREQAADMGALLAPMLGSKQGAADMSLQFVKLATDLGSFNNIPTGEALEKIRAGLVGEAEPLRSLGVLLTEASTKEWAYTHGIAARGKELTEVQKVEARAGQIMAQTALAQGDATRTAGSMANQMKALKSNVSDAATEIGMKLIPYALGAVAAFNNNWPQIQQIVGQVLGVVGTAIAGVAAKLQSWGPQIASGLNIAKGAMGGFASFMSSGLGQFVTIAAGSAVAFGVAMQKIIAAWKLLSVAFVSNPFGAAAVALGLFIGYLVTMKTTGAQTTQALKDVKAALDALKSSAASAAGAELTLAEAKNRLKAAALTVTDAIKSKQAAQDAGGRSSQAYKTAENQVEAAYIARRRATLEVKEATASYATEQGKATAVQNTAKGSVEALTSAFQGINAAGKEYQTSGSRAAIVTQEIQAQMEKQMARRFAGEMQDLAQKAGATAAKLKETDPALSAMAKGIEKAATAKAKLALEMGKIPGVVSAIKGPAVQNMDAVGAGVAGSATTQGSKVGANFALGMAAGIAANSSAAAIQAALMVNKAYSSASTAGQMHSPSKLTMKLGEFFVDGFVIGVKNKQAVLAALGSTIVQDFIMGITTKAPEFTGKMAEIAGAAVEAARAKVEAMQGRITEAFGRLGEYAKRAFEEKVKGMADGIAREFEAKIGGIKAFQASLTPAELQLQQMDKSEQERQRASALATAQAALVKAEALDAGVEKEAAVAAAKEQIRAVEQASIRVALEEQAAVERAHRDQAAALQIAFLEEAKAKELANLEERTAQQGTALATQLTQLQNRLATHPEEYNKIQKKIITLLNSYGVSFKNSGVALGNAFAQGIRNAETAVRNAARALAQAAANQLQLKSPAKEGPLSTLDKWWKPIGPMLAKQMDGSAIASAASRMAAGAVGGASGGPRMAMAGGSGGGNTYNIYASTTYGDDQSLQRLVGKIRQEIQRGTARNG